MKAHIQYTTRHDRAFGELMFEGKRYTASAAFSQKGIESLREWAKEKIGKTELKESVELPSQKINEDQSMDRLVEMIQIVEYYGKNTVHLPPNDPMVQKLTKASFPEYKGREFKAVTVPNGTEIDISSYWNDGSRDFFVIVDLNTFKTLPVPQNGSGFDKKYAPVKMREGICIVEDTVFRGKHIGLTFIISESNATKLLPSNKDELTMEEKVVLSILRGVKSAYRKRYWQDAGFSDAKVKDLMSGLVANGYLQKNGALTPDGKNAAGSALTNDPERMIEKLKAMS